MMTKPFDEMIQDMVDGIGYSRMMVHNQPHLLMKLDRLEARLFAVSDAVFKDFAASDKTGTTIMTTRSVFDFGQVRREIIMFMQHALDNHKPEETC
jgi:hypothetical protein